MARDPERRAKSREMDKIRKRTRRAIARLEREQSKVSGNFLKLRAIRQQIEDYKRDLSQLTARGRDRTYTEKGLAALEKLKSEYVAPAQRKGGVYDFAREISKARAGKRSALGRNAALKVKMFYYATQNLWEYADPAKRNEAILQALKPYGIESLEQAYSYVMTSDPEIARVLSDVTASQGGAIADTDTTMGTAYYQAKRIHGGIDGTPTQFIRVQQIEAIKAYGA